MMLDVRAPIEAALRSLDAFVLTARKHDIPADSRCSHSSRTMGRRESLSRSAFRQRARRNL